MMIASRKTDDDFPSNHSENSEKITFQDIISVRKKWETSGKKKEMRYFSIYQQVYKNWQRSHENVGLKLCFRMLRVSRFNEWKELLKAPLWFLPCFWLLAFLLVFQHFVPLFGLSFPLGQYLVSNFVHQSPSFFTPNKRVWIAPMTRN